MRVLITGAFGFVGKHLLREMLAAGHEVSVFDMAEAPPEFSGIKAVKGDIRDAAATDRAVADAAPDACVHLSGIAFVPNGWVKIRNVFDVNLSGTINLLEAFRKRFPSARILSISSSEVYGHAPRDHALTEDDLLNPGNPYAISKAAADLTVLSYAREHGIPAMTARPSNHTGPGQSPDFVVPSLARQIAAIALRKAPPVITAGNLDSRRDFTDVRDVARAYRLLIEKGHGGMAYNIASGAPVAIRQLFDGLCDIAGVRPEIETDSARLRSADERPALDTARIRDNAGWRPDIPLSRTLRDIIADFEVPGTDPA
jgi:GDP-4-dehydro-6-deoxy-D-mannose reductase